MKLGNYVVAFHHQNNTHVAPLLHQMEVDVTFTVPKGEEKNWGGQSTITTEKIQVMVTKLPEPSFTECRISNIIQPPIADSKGEVTGENEPIYQEIGIGISAVHDGDNFCYETGRRISLERALQSANLDKLERAELWEAYRTSTPTPRWGPDELAGKTLDILEEAYKVRKEVGCSIADARAAVLRMPKASTEERVIWLKSFFEGRQKVS